MTDQIEDEVKPAADPMAKARAAKARKALEEAEKAAAAAELAAAPIASAQPVVSSLKTKAANPYMGDPVACVVTAWGHGQISTGGEHGFERYARGAEVMIPEHSARSLFNKRWIEPKDASFAEKWFEANQREIAMSMAAKRNTEFRMENGVAPGENWASSQTMGDLSFSPRDEDFRG